MGCHCNFEGFKRLVDQMLVRVLSCKSKHTYDDRPARLDVSRLHCANLCHTHHNECCDFWPSVNVIQDYSFERFQEVLLEIEASELFFY